MKLGKLIQTARINRRLSQRELADRGEMSRSQIIRIEKGECIPKMETLDSIIGALAWSALAWSQDCLADDSEVSALLESTWESRRLCLRQIRKDRRCEKVLRAMLRAIRDKEIK